MSEIIFHVFDGDQLLSECENVGAVLLACWTHLYTDLEEGPLTIKTAKGKRVGQAYESFGDIVIGLRREAIDGL